MGREAKVVFSSQLAIRTLRKNGEGIGPDAIGVKRAPRVRCGVTGEVGGKPRIPISGPRKLVCVASLPLHGLRHPHDLALGRPHEHGLHIRLRLGDDYLAAIRDSKARPRSP
jgi:hypothetical protein